MKHAPITASIIAAVFAVCLAAAADFSQSSDVGRYGQRETML
jgi:hypothetical protein